MVFGATGFPFLGSIITTPLVGFVSDHLQMSLIHTHTIVAQVVDLLLPWDEPILIAETHDVNSDCLSIKTHARVSPTSSRPGVRSLPNMTGTWDSVNLETKKGDDDSRHDLVTDHLATIHGQISSRTRREPLNSPLGERLLVSTAVTV